MSMIVKLETSKDQSTYFTIKYCYKFKVKKQYWKHEYNNVTGDISLKGKYSDPMLFYVHQPTIWSLDLNQNWGKTYVWRVSKEQYYKFLAFYQMMKIHL